jgi:hypothetical protein
MFRNWNSAAAAAGLAPSAVVADHGVGQTREKLYDWYLQYMGAFTAYDTMDPVLLGWTLPGWLEYVQELGFARGAILTGARPFDPIVPADFDWSRLGGRKLYASYPQPWFPEPLTPSDVHARLYSKANLQTIASGMGVPVIPGSVAHSYMELLQMVESLGLPVFIKGDHGSGSDFVQAVGEMTQVPDAVRYMFDGDLPQAFPYPLIVQMDARTHPRLSNWEVLGSYCLTGVVGPTKEILIGITEQIIQTHPDGRNEWLGSRAVYLDAAHVAVISRGFSDFAAYCRTYGHVGPVGPDMFLVRDSEDGELTAVFFDPNIRFPISAYGWFISGALGMPFWATVNVTMPWPVVHMQTVLDLGLDHRAGYVWAASRSTPDTPSPTFKLVIGGANQQQLQERIDGLSEHGIVVGT